MSRGYVLYQGPSLLDGAPIVVIATFGSKNPKTGSGPQTWIMRADVPPHEAVNTGDDASVCGDCPHRGRLEDGRNVERSCYVRTFQAPLSVWRAWKRGLYSDRWHACTFLGEFVRLGAYGDPAAVPRDVWVRVVQQARGWTGYTHQWRTGLALADLCMASCETAEDESAAQAMGYRTFRLTEPGAPRLPGHMVCPASAERGHLLQCHACRACSGTGRRGHVQIAVHGTGARHALPIVKG